MLRLAVFSLMVSACVGSYMADHRRLLEYILNSKEGKYDVSARPVRDINTRMLIDVEFHLNGVQEVDMRRGVMTSSGWVGYMWMNEYAQWNPEEFGGIKEIRVNPKNLWTPDVYLFNDASGQYNKRIVENSNSNNHMLVHSDGSTYWFTPTIYESLCDSPDDGLTEISCPLVFGSWTFHEELVDLNTTASADLNNFNGNTEWELLGAPATRHSKIYECCPEPYVDITWDIKLAKRVHPTDEDHGDDEDDEHEKHDDDEDDSDED